MAQHIPAIRFQDPFAAQFLDRGGAVVNVMHPDFWAPTFTERFVTAADSLADGHTLLIPRGEYSLHRPSGRDALFDYTDRKNIRITGEPGARLVIDHDFSTNTSFRFLSANGCENIVIDGLNIDAQITGTPTETDLRAMLFRYGKSTTNPAGDLTIRNSRLRIQHPEGAEVDIEHGSSEAAKLSLVWFGADDNDPPAQGFVFTGNTVHDTTARIVWLWNAGDLLIHGNRFLDCPGDYPIIRAQVFRGRNIRITDNHLRKAETGTGPLIELDGKVVRGARDVVIAGNNLVCWGGHIGINLVDVQQAVVYGNTIQNHPDSDPPTQSGPTFAGIRVRNSQVAAPDTTQQTPTGDIRIFGNIIRGRPSGISIEADGPTGIESNTIQDCNGRGINIRGGAITVVGNHVRNNGAALGTSGHGIYLDHLPPDINDNVWTIEGTISGNIVVGNAGSGIERTGQDGTGVVVVTGNFVRGNGHWGIRGNPQWMIVGNHLSDNASGDHSGSVRLVSLNVGAIGRRGPILSTSDGGNKHDFDPEDAEIIRFTSDSNFNLTGLSGGVGGRVLILQKTAGGTMTILPSNTNSASGNRFATPGAAAFQVGPYEGVTVWYDPTGVWRVVGRA